MKLSICILLVASIGSWSAMAADRPKPVEVVIKDLRYNPSSVRVKVGQVVRWVNKDDRDHTVDIKVDKEVIKSGSIHSGDNWEHTFERAGKFNYSCSFHPRMNGMVIVEEAGK